MIKVLLADDQALIRQAFAALLNLEHDLEVVGQASDGTEAIKLAAERHPDVIVMDIQMPEESGTGDGITATAQIVAADPSIRVIIVTTFGRPGYLRRGLQAGAAGFVVKDTPARELADAVRRVHQGLRVVDPALATDSLIAGESPLTARETDVLRTARSGGTVADIAGALFLSEGTVRNHLSAVIGKTGARTRAEAAQIAESNGWL